MPVTVMTGAELVSALLAGHATAHCAHLQLTDYRLPGGCV